MRALLLSGWLLSLLPFVALGQQAETHAEILDRGLYAGFSFVGSSGRTTLSSRWLQLRMTASDGSERLMSMFCAHESRQGLSFWTPADGHLQGTPTVFPGTLWIDQGIIGSWQLEFQPRGIRVWSSVTKTASLQDACDWGVRSFEESYDEIRSKLSTYPQIHKRLVGQTIDLEKFLGSDDWMRPEGCCTRGGESYIDRIIAIESGWRVYIAGLDGIRYEVDLDEEWNLVRKKRIKP